MAGKFGRFLVAALACAWVIGAEPAAAGEYTVVTCRATSSFASHAFGNFASRGMFVKPACNPEGRGVRGLVVGNLRRNGRVRGGAASLTALNAPKGAHFKRYAWSGETARSDCGFSIYSYAKGPGNEARSVGTRRKANRHPFRRCPARGRFQASGNPRPTIHIVGNDVRGASRIVHRVKCHARSGCAASGVNWVRIFKAAVTVSDRTAPLVAITGGSVVSRRWVGGRQSVQYAALDNVGVRSGRAVSGAATLPAAPRPCDYTRLVPCGNGVAAFTVDTKQLREGTQLFAVDATDSAGNIRRAAAADHRRRQHSTATSGRQRGRRTGPGDAHRASRSAGGTLPRETALR